MSRIGLSHVGRWCGLVATVGLLALFLALVSGQVATAGSAAAPVSPADDDLQVVEPSAMATGLASPAAAPPLVQDSPRV